MQIQNPSLKRCIKDWSFFALGVEKYIYVHPKATKEEKFPQVLLGNVLAFLFISGWS